MRCTMICCLAASTTCRCYYMLNVLTFCGIGRVQSRDMECLVETFFLFSLFVFVEMIADWYGS